MKTAVILSVLVMFVSQLPLFGGLLESAARLSSNTPETPCFSAARLRHERDSQRQFSSSLWQETGTPARSKTGPIVRPYRRAYAGNILCSLFGGLLIGYGLNALLNPTDSRGGNKDLGIAYGSVLTGAAIGGSLGSAVSLRTEDMHHFGKIVGRAFLPHALTFLVSGLALSGVTEQYELLTGAFIMGWLLSPVTAVEAYLNYNPAPSALQSGAGPLRSCTHSGPPAVSWRYSVQIAL